MQKLWFKRKTFGWGWTPASIEGWLITVLYIGIVVYLGIELSEPETAGDVILNFVLPVFALTLLFVHIAYRTGESPRWQWGKRKED